MPLVTFYFDPVSPYAWLAATALPRIEQAGASVALQPVLFAGLLNAHENKGPAEIPAKRAYLFRDVMRQAARLGLRFSGPPGHPFNPLLALRMSIALTDPSERRRFALAVMSACWEAGEDVSDSATLSRLARACALDGDALLAAAQHSAVKQRLADETARAVEDGVFGVPSFRLGDELFWGGDRIDALLWRLQGGGIDEPALEAFLQRPPLAQRRV